ncbi:MAG: 1-acyl-sn-glycerol-3-phosphate acyltransferase [Desulfuromonadales bacterium]|nr:1-acyl-sn-glycerol-3-phosphate acyltransferase [Desulfuromonadales bacterium]
MVNTVWQASRQARQGDYDDRAWGESSRRIIEALEAVGVEFQIEGVENFSSLSSPCVFIGNHMSTLETFVLPTLIVAHQPVTFVVKKSLVDYPIFRHVMVSRNPVVVERSNPRDDLKVVLEEGTKRLQSGVSIAVFPQTTRTVDFNPAQFNSIGIKLAKRAAVPVVPVALKTDAWGNGRWFKDFGRIDPTRRVHFAFGPPIAVEGNGSATQAAVVEFIQGKLAQWQEEQF